MRFSTERYKFDSEFYNGVNERMLELTIYCKGPTKVQLYLDARDIEQLKKSLQDRSHDKKDCFICHS